MKRGAKQKPMTLTEYAARRGVSQPTVTRAVQSGRLRDSVVRGPNGDPLIVDAALADREWDANTDPTKVRKAHTAEPAESEEDLIAATTRLKVAQADTAELKLRRERAELVPASDVDRGVAQDYTAVRAAMMALPSQLKLDLPHLTLEDLTAIKSRVREALTVLSRGASTE